MLSASFLSASPIEREKRVAEVMALFPRFGEDALGVKIQNGEDVLSFRFNDARTVASSRHSPSGAARPCHSTAPLPPKAVDRALGITARVGPPQLGWSPRSR
jgi:hypothetical protein